MSTVPHSVGLTTYPLVTLAAAALTIGTLGRKFVYHTLVPPPPNNALNITLLVDEEDGYGASAVSPPFPPLSSETLTPRSPAQSLASMLGADPLLAAIPPSAVEAAVASARYDTVEAGEEVFGVGDGDDHVYLVLSGKLRVEVGDALLRWVLPGQSLVSIISFLEVLAGRESTFKSVSATAEEASTVCAIPMASFTPAMLQPGSNVIVPHVLEVILLKLARVTFLTMYSYLGLTRELVVPDSETDGSGGRVGGDDDDVGRMLTGREAFASLFGCPESVIPPPGEGLETLTLTAGQTILSLSPSSGLVVVLSGSLSLSLGSSTLYTVHVGDMCGQLAVLTRDASVLTASATSTGAVVATLSREAFWVLVDAHPDVLQTVAVGILSRLSPLVRRMDFATGWLHLKSGQFLYTPGDPASDVYIVLSGRVRVQRGGEVSTCARGDLLGEREMLAGISRVSLAMATRDAQLVRLSKETFTYICSSHPALAMRIASRMSRAALRGESGYPDCVPAELPRSNTVATIAVIPLNSSVRTGAFLGQFMEALADSAPDASVVGVDEDWAEAHCRTCGGGGSNNTSYVDEVVFNDALSRLEDVYEYVVYSVGVERPSGAWLGRALRQADLVVFVSDAGVEGKDVVAAESIFQGLALETRSELVLIHSEETKLPSGTQEWLSVRPWIDAHHHLREGDDSLLRRAVRRMIGRSVAVVLGGGGAKGFAHIGMLSEFEAQGEEVDALGGTSIGACVAAVYGMEMNAAAVLERMLPFAGEMSNRWRKVLDLTYPATAVMTGRAFNNALQMLLGEGIDMCDLWIPIVVVSTDITKGRARVHGEGELWRYVRASMTLTGWLPPICDPKDSHLLVDGGYVANVPADTVIEVFNPRRVLAIDIGAKSSDAVTFYGDELSGWWLLWKRWYPFTQPAAIPSMQEISSTLAYVAGDAHLETHVVGREGRGGLEYLTPPIQRFETLEFDRALEIYGVGVAYARERERQRAQRAAASVGSAGSGSERSEWPRASER